ncbi:toll/interleukin-1 receptor domain-containing protein [Streptomyces collinus]|uniref:toll/interleukin-1 receptor domain-containing protein n=1 Tax=Streptomyces collinus TaxID=42684 RepID=UPI0036A2E144
MTDEHYDIFICHASEDKQKFVKPLAESLQQKGVAVWYDEFSVRLTDRIHEALDRGIRSSEYGVIVLSPSFLNRPLAHRGWLDDEIGGIIAKERLEGREMIIPLRLDVTRQDVARHSPILAARSGMDAKGSTRKNNTEVERVASELLNFVQPGLWSSWRRGQEYMRHCRDMNKSELSRIFPFRLQDLPAPYLANTELDLLIVCGPSRYDLTHADKSRVTKKVRTSHAALDFFIDSGTSSLVPLDNYSMDRDWSIQLGESTLNVSMASEIALHLANLAAIETLPLASCRHILPYIEVSSEELRSHNLICISCGDVNAVEPIAIAAFELANATVCPVHHQPYDSSEAVYSEVTSESYDKDTDAGFILLLPNPWNRDKAILFCGGNTGLGTQAALLRIDLAMTGTKAFTNEQNIPYSIVGATHNQASRLVKDQHYFEGAV